RGAVRPGRAEQVRFGAGGQDRAGVVDDPVRDQPGLPGPLRRQHQDLVLQPRVQTAAVLGAPQPDRVLGRPAGQPFGPGEAGGGGGRRRGGAGGGGARGTSARGGGGGGGRGGGWGLPRQRSARARFRAAAFLLITSR